MRRRGERVPTRRRPDRFALTDAEQRVAALVADGLSNRQIADRLAYSVKTIEAYLSRVYAKTGWLGQYFDAWGIKTAFSPLGITIAMTFIGLPFVVRTLQPALAELDGESEEAAASLGATRWQTFYKVIVPTVMPALLTGFALAFARALGEYGSVVFISGNMPYKTEIAPILIVARLEEFAYGEATAIAVVLLAISFSMLLFINLLESWTRRHAS